MAGGTGPLGLSPDIVAMLTRGNTPTSNAPMGAPRYPQGIPNGFNQELYGYGPSQQSQQSQFQPIQQDNSGSTFASYLKAMGINLGDNAGPDLTAGVAGQYNPLLGHLRKSIGRTKKEAKKSDKNLAEIYSAMAKMDQKDAAKIAAQGRRSTKEIQSKFDTGSQRIDAMNRRMEQDVVDRNAALGIEDATASSVNPLQKQARAGQVDLNTRSADQVSASKSNTNNWSNYARSAAINSRLAGANQRAELAGQLSDALFGIRGQIAQTRSDKAGAMLSAQQSEAGANSANDSLRADLFGQFTDTMLAKQKAMADAQGNAPSPTGYGAAGQGISQYLRSVQDPNAKSDTTSILNMLQQNAGSIANPADAMGKTNPTTIQDFIAKLMEIGKSRNYRPESLNAIANVAPDLFQFIQKGSGING
jgi:hypothetical protein